ncbi:hypothetical protein UFOVP207_48 [uncultured Caudovirales phage]|uniref:Uncharacterized protein n=1 Tax=uncultured Caudovirales phage TaxID=2100421 RepID=A0A6J7WMP0_9CAUD|nr:hypothetical protein UFOVP207_48 [uncultured Caudovirales phage]
MSNRGGARPNSGRKPKDEENRIRDLMMPYSLDAIQCLANIVVSDKSKDTDKISASKIIIEYAYGKPKEKIETDLNVTNFDVKELFKINRM